MDDWLYVHDPRNQVNRLVLALDVMYDIMGDVSRNAVFPVSGKATRAAEGLFIIRQKDNR